MENIEKYSLSRNKFNNIDRMLRELREVSKEVEDSHNKIDWVKINELETIYDDDWSMLDNTNNK